MSKVIKVINEIRNTDINGNFYNSIIKCKKCGKEIKNITLKYKIINGQRIADMDGSNHGVPCKCGWWN